MFRKLLDRFRPVRVEDPFFGPLLYMKMPRDRLSYWEGARRFAATGKTAEVFIDAASPTEPPMQAQRDFFRRLETDYPEVCSIVADAFAEDEWARKLMKGPFEKAFSLSSLSIPLCVEPDEEWEITFRARKDEEHLFSATMSGLAVTGVSVDG
jgi:hypothetical protein